MKYEEGQERVCVCFYSRSEVCGEEESSSPPGNDQRGLSTYHDGQQQRRYTHRHTSNLILAGVITLNKFSHASTHTTTSLTVLPIGKYCVCVCAGFHASRFPRSSTGNHRELHEADPNDSAGSAGVKVTTVAAAPL